MNSKNNVKLSKRYAGSLVSTMLKDGHSKDDIVQGLTNVKTILDNSNELYNVLLNPVISAFDKESIIESVFEKDCIETVRNFLKLLVSKNRFNLIYSIIEELFKIVDKLNNIVKINVTSAIELEKQRKKEIQEKLSSKLNKTAKVSYLVDDSIIAGLVYKTDDNILDTSFLHKLEDLKKELI